jgi:hypothetical protein
VIEGADYELIAMRIISEKLEQIFLDAGILDWRIFQFDIYDGAPVHQIENVFQKRNFLPFVVYFAGIFILIMPETDRVKPFQLITSYGFDQPNTVGGAIDQLVMNDHEFAGRASLNIQLQTVNADIQAFLEGYKRILRRPMTPTSVRDICWLRFRQN